MKQIEVTNYFDNHMTKHKAGHYFMGYKKALDAYGKCKTADFFMAGIATND